jgi:hypothetical protein
MMIFFKASLPVYADLERPARPLAQKYANLAGSVPQKSQRQLRWIVSPAQVLIMISGPIIHGIAPNRINFRLKQYATALVFLLHESVKLRMR